MQYLANKEARYVHTNSVDLTALVVQWGTTVHSHFNFF